MDAFERLCHKLGIAPRATLNRKFEIDEVDWDAIRNYPDDSQDDEPSDIASE